MTGAIRVGCSGWSYDDWRGPVYPPELKPKQWFAAYAALFDTVEINSSFYRLPSPSTADAWATQAPGDFLYALKVGQFGSHRKKLIDPEPWLANHLDRARRLGPHLGPNLVQLPPRWKRNVQRLDDFLSVAPKDIRWAVEFRDDSWLHDDVFGVLERHGAALCVHDLIVGHPWIRTTSWSYVRFHGPDAVEHRYVGEYGPSRLAPIAERLDTWRGDGADIYAYFNNDTHGYAVNDAAWLRGQLVASDAAA